MFKFLLYRTAILFYKKDFSLVKRTVLQLNESNAARHLIHNNCILVKLLISGEDHRFKYHPIGFDIIAIIRAVRNNVFYNRREGASTIEQQLVRVILGDFERSIKRKIKEIVLASTLSFVIERHQIPVLYLFYAYYGTNMNGLNELRQRLRIEDLNSISTEQAAEIISRIKYPEPRSCNERTLKNIERRKFHLLNLYKKHSSQKLFNVYG